MGAAFLKVAAVTVKDAQAQLDAYKAMMGSESKLLGHSESSKSVQQMVRKAANSAEKKLMALHANLVAQAEADATVVTATDKFTTLEAGLAEAKASFDSKEAQVKALDESCRSAR